MTHALGPLSMLSVLLLRPSHDDRRFFLSSLTATTGSSVPTVGLLYNTSGGGDRGLLLRSRDDGLD